MKLKYLRNCKNEDKLTIFKWSEHIEHESENFVVLTMTYNKKWGNYSFPHIQSSWGHNGLGFIQETPNSDHNYAGMIRVKKGWLVLMFSQHKESVVMTLVKDNYSGSY